ncbi:PEP-CTERM sorting domain-containing protein [Luteolibacter pohnpeiensis]|uniref:PEP-CTERM sorting domain-containing protein n=1 Tax=Luteolibacter pohnpeiensis TaxID=454153 RepID=A0A934VVZ2_9BACT|nr:PEP-CTERM sorting domain-containing protein [Luteolibacter pohnpeiensis]MBK1882278.1 PEP-CTERM sorting domain-containing protein [Luteolibacter pohnpeiensis]
MKRFATLLSLCSLVPCVASAAIIYVVPTSDNTLPYNSSSGPEIKNDFDITTGEATPDSVIYPPTTVEPAADQSFGFSFDSVEAFLWQQQSTRNYISFATYVSSPPNDNVVVFDEGITIGSTTDFGSWYNSDIPINENDFTLGTSFYVAFTLQQDTGSGSVSLAPVQYGWMEILITDTEYTILGWAYESEPGVSIVVGAVPEPSVPLVLGLSSMALVLRRKRRA